MNVQYCFVPSCKYCLQKQIHTLVNLTRNLQLVCESPTQVAYKTCYVTSHILLILEVAMMSSTL